MSATTPQRSAGQRLAWAIVGLLWAGSLALGVLALGGRAPVHPTIGIPWWVLVLCFAAAESWVVHLHFRSETGSFSLYELPMLLGLVFASPLTVWVTTIVGTSFAFLVIRRQPAIKALFNIANLSTQAALAALVINQLLGPDPLSPRSWIVLGGATIVTGAAQILALAAVILATEGAVRRRQLMSMLLTGAVVSATNTALALVAAVLLDARPASLLLLAVPVAVVAAAYRSYVAERNQREQVEFLYASTRALRQQPETTSAVGSLLGEVVSMFRAQRSTLYLFHDDGGDDEPITATRFDHENGTTVAHAVDRHDPTIDGLVTLGSTPTIVHPTPTGGPAASFLAAEGVRDGIVGTLHGAKRIVGVLLVTNRLGQVTSFTNEDVRLFGTLAAQAAVALENDQLEQALAEMRQLERSLAHQASHDGLTGLANRTRFAEALDAACLAGDAVAVLYVDLDDFKVVNDTLGHAAGDHVLVEVGRRLRASVRPDDLVARLGGDEFGVLLHGTDNAADVAHRIVEVLHEPLRFAGHDARIGASVGLARAEGGGADPSDLLSDADVAMYAAKSRGKGAVVVFEPSMRDAVWRQHKIRTQLRRAIDHDEFDVVYQPIVELTTGRPVGAEALVRWNSDDGMRLPESFIDEAERAGYVVSIDRNVLAKVAAVLAAPQPAGPGFVSVNLSASNFVADDLSDHVAAVLESTGVPGGRLVVEITESALLEDLDGVIRQLGRLRRFGVRVALDDFGTGYSSLSLLHRLPADLLKIARPFVADVADDVTFVRTMIELGHNLGLEVVAEGVETESQLTVLAGLGCDHVQGYLVARPMGRNELGQWLGDPALKFVPLPVDEEATSKTRLRSGGRMWSPAPRGASGETGVLHPDRRTVP